MHDSAPQLANFNPLDEVALAETLALENDDILKRAVELLAGAKVWLDAPALESDDEAADLADFLKQLSNISGDKGIANTRREARKSPYSVCADVVQKFFKRDVIDPLEEAREKLAAKANLWMERKRAKATAEAARLAAEARAKLESAKTADEVLAAAELGRKAQQVAKPSGIKSDFGSGLHQTRRWTFEIVDASKIPAKFMIVDPVSVRAAIKMGVREIPGLLIKQETSVVGR